MKSNYKKNGGIWVSFDEYLRRNPMPTMVRDNENYTIVEVNDNDRE